MAEIFLRSILRSGKILIQNCAILRNALRKRNYESPNVSNDVQSSETLRNSLVLNTNQLLYQLTRVIYVILGDVLTLILTCVVTSRFSMPIYL